jgi:hypothetical protein
MPAFREAMKVEDYAGAYIVLPEGLEVMTDTVCETNSDPKRPASLNESQCDAMLAA